MNRIANVLVDRLGLIPGGRVLLRAANTPMMAACYLAVLKAGGIAVGTMPLLRARELKHPIEKARIALALCDARLGEEMVLAQAASPSLARVVMFETDAADGLEAMMAAASPEFAAVDTEALDVALIAFTSGTTGVPKGTMHTHRDLLATCDSYARHVLRPEAGDRFIGSPPLAFTFGLGGMLLFPLCAGASTVLMEKPGPDELLAGIERHGATICFTAPTAYRAMLGKLEGRDLSSLRKCVSAGRRCRGRRSRRGSGPRASASWTASARPRCCTSSSVSAPRTRSPAALKPANRRGSSRSASPPPSSVLKA